MQGRAGEARGLEAQARRAAPQARSDTRMKYLGFALLFVLGPPLLLVTFAATWTLWFDILEFILRNIK
jgi:hypothetical protein